jgi:hypothetical protein
LLSSAQRGEHQLNCCELEGKDDGIGSNQHMLMGKMARHTAAEQVFAKLAHLLSGFLFDVSSVSCNFFPSFSHFSQCYLDVVQLLMNPCQKYLSVMINSKSGHM